MKIIISFKECVERIHRTKAIPYNINNILKDIEYDKEIVIQEICNNLNEESKS